MYWPLEPRINLSVWIAISPIGEEQGRLRLIPGSHTRWLDDEYQQLEKEAAFGTGLAPEQVDEGSRVEFELAPGQAVFFNEAGECLPFPLSLSQSFCPGCQRSSC